MARRSDKSGKIGSGQLPADVFAFRQSGSANHNDAEHSPRLANLSPAEQRLYDELLALARRLDKRGVSGVYGLVANVADQVTLLKQQGQSTVAALARGLDALKQIDDTHTGKRLKAMREAMADHEETIASAVIALLFAIGCAIAGFASDPGWFYISIFVSAVAVALTLPAVWDLLTRR